MFNKQLFPIALLVSIVSVNINAAPVDNLYVGLAVNNNNLSSGQYLNTTVKGSSFVTGGVLVGYQFLEYFSVQYRFHFSVKNDKKSYITDQVQHIGIAETVNNQHALLIKGTYPVATNFGVYGIAGLYRANLSTSGGIRILTSNNILSFDNTNTLKGLTYGVGMEYKLSPKLGLAAEYQLYTVNEKEKNIQGRDWSSLNIVMTYSF